MEQAHGARPIRMTASITDFSLTATYENDEEDQLTLLIDLGGPVTNDTIRTTAKIALSGLSFGEELSTDVATKKPIAASLLPNGQETRFIPTPESSAMDTPPRFRSPDARSHRSACSLDLDPPPQYTEAEVRLLEEINNLFKRPDLQTLTPLQIYSYIMDHADLLEAGFANPSTNQPTAESIKKGFDLNNRFQKSHLQVSEFGLIKGGQIREYPIIRRFSDLELRGPSPELSVQKITEVYRTSFIQRFELRPKYPLKTQTDVQVFFNFVKGQNHLAWGCRADGCYARAQVVADYCRAFSLPSESFCQAILVGRNLGVVDRKVHEWNFHMATAIETEDHSLWIIDPSSNQTGPQSPIAWIQESFLTKLDITFTSVSDYRICDPSTDIQFEFDEEDEPYEFSLVPTGMYYQPELRRMVPLSIEHRIQSSYQNTVGRRIEATDDYEMGAKLEQYRTRSPSLVEHITKGFL